MIDEHLGLVSEPPKRAAMNDAVAVALKLTAILRWRLGIAAAARLLIVRRIEASGESASSEVRRQRRLQRRIRVITGHQRLAEPSSRTRRTRPA